MKIHSGDTPPPTLPSSLAEPVAIPDAAYLVEELRNNSTPIRQNLFYVCFLKVFAYVSFILVISVTKFQLQKFKHFEISSKIALLD